MDPGRETRSAPRALVGLIAAFVLLAGSVSIINPLFEAPDETRNYRYVRILVTEHRLPVQGEEAARAQSHHTPLYYALSAFLSAWVPSSHDSTFHQPGNPFWAYRNWTVGIDNKLQYWHGPAERFPFREGYLAVMVARWVNVLLGAATVATTYHLALRALRSKPESRAKMQREEGPKASIAIERRTLGPQNGSQKVPLEITAPRAILDRGRLARSAPIGPKCAAVAMNTAVPAGARMRARCKAFRCPRSAQTLALAAAAIVALNPQFIYLSAAINNDIVVALCGAALLLASVSILQEGLGLRRLVGLGVVAGLALLSKLQIAAIGPAVALSLALAARPDSGDTVHMRRQWLVAWLRALLIVGIITGIVCGWWYVRNLRLYGEITGMSKQAEMWYGRDAGDNLWAIRQGLPQLWASLWGRGAVLATGRSLSPAR